MLTDLEHEVVEDLAQIYNKLCLIVGNDDSRLYDLTEIAMLIHGLQDKVLAQAAARLFPEKYRLMGASFHYDKS